MKFIKSIRWQLQMWHGLLLLLVICAFGVTAYQLEKAEQIRSIDAGLQQRLSLLVNMLRGNPREDGRARPRAPLEQPARIDEQRVRALASSAPLEGVFQAEGGYYFVVWMRGSSPIARSANAPPEVPRPEERGAVSRVRAGEFRESFIFAAPVDCVLVGHSMRSIEATILRHAALLAAAGAVLLALGLAGGWWLTNRALRPVREISATASRIAGGDLSQRINAPGSESELGELTAVLNATFSRLDAAFTQQARFTSDAAHELRTPLTVLLMQTQAALARERNAGEYRDALQSNQSTAQRMKKLVESLLQLARLDAGQEPLKRAKCDLAFIAADCAELIQPLADARGITIQSELSPAPCEADAERIAQVVTNLLKNAIDYNQPNGSISIRTYHGNGRVVCEVSDTGCGISSDQLPHVFDRFYRADDSRTDSASRSGLGLAISRAIIDAHGGTIEAAGRENAGATFRFSIAALC